MAVQEITGQETGTQFISKLNSNFTGLSTKRPMRILAIGNSFTRDALSYVPIILAEMDIDVEIGILYKANCSLQMHWENRASSTYYEFDHYTASAGKWTTTQNKGLADGLSAAEWDLVLFNQVSTLSVDYTSYQPYLNNLIDLIAGTLPNVRFGWLLTHAWADGYSAYSSLTGISNSTEMLAAIKSAVESVWDNTPIQVILPYGLAIQLARGNSTLNAIGDFNGTGGNGGLTAEGLHLQDGIGCQIAAYAVCAALLEDMGSHGGILGNEVRVNDAFLVTYAIPQPHPSTSPITAGSTDANCLLGQKYAIMAVKEAKGIAS